MNTNKDLYAILGINRSASEKEIKTAYRKLALRYHPDKQGGKSDAEKKEAEEKFKSISFAYSILSDSEKKQRYDQYGITDDQDMGGGGFDASEIFKHFMGGFGSMFGGDPFENFFGGGHRDREPRKMKQKGQSIKMRIPIGIEEILNGINRDIEYTIQIRCSKCKGKGGEGVEICSHCHGTGMLTEVHQSGFGIIQNSRPCPYCHSTGKIIKNKCTECDGTGLKSRNVKIHVNFGPGIENGFSQLYKGKGYESNDPNEENGDLLLEFVYNLDVTKYHIQGNMIYEKIIIPYYDAILGGRFDKKLPNGDNITYDIQPYAKDGDIINLRKRYGNLFYNLLISVSLPEKSSDLKGGEEKLLRQIKDFHKESKKFGGK